MSLNTRIVNIEGMTCGGCVRSVHNTVSKIDGVESLSVNLDDNLATVTYDTDNTSIEAIASAIDDAGFNATVANS